VLTSSVTRQSSIGETVFDTNLAAITVPVLVVANQNDACPVTPPGDAPRIAAALVHSPRKDVVYVQSDQTHSPVCEAMAPHGYYGIEAAVVQRVADWIRAASARLRLFPKEHGRAVAPAVDFDEPVVAQNGDTGIPVPAARFLAEEARKLLWVHIALPLRG